MSSREEGGHPRLPPTAAPGLAAMVQSRETAQPAPRAGPRPPSCTGRLIRSPRDARDFDKHLFGITPKHKASPVREHSLQKQNVLLTGRNDGARPQGVLYAETLVNGRVTVILCTGTKGGQHITRFLLPAYQMSAALRGPQVGCADQQGEGTEKRVTNKGV